MGGGGCFRRGRGECDSVPGGPRDRSRRALGIAVRGGILYLAVAWLLLKLIAPDLESGPGNESLARAAALGLLAGVPVIVMVARRFGPLPVGAAAIWGSGLLAAVSGLAVSSLCVTTASTPRKSDSSAPEYLPASLRSGGQLRLRIDGLTVSGARSPGATPKDSEAELVIATHIIEEGPDAGLLRVRARLVDDRGRVLWERCDDVDPDDIERLHRAVLRALAEGMVLTGQGGGTIAGFKRQAHPLAG